MKRKPAVKRKQALTPRRGPKLPDLGTLPTPMGVAAVEGMLDAVEKAAVDSGLKGAAVPAMRAVFGMLLGAAINEKKIAKLEVEGMAPVAISKADAQFVAIKSFVDLTRLEVNHAVTKLAEKGALKFYEPQADKPKTVGDSLSVRAANVLTRLFDISVMDEKIVMDLTPGLLKDKLIAFAERHKHPVRWCLLATKGCGRLTAKKILDWIGGDPDAAKK